jgi:hypothetical protein
MVFAPTAPEGLMLIYCLRGKPFRFKHLYIVTSMSSAKNTASVSQEQVPPVQLCFRILKRELPLRSSPASPSLSLVAAKSFSHYRGAHLNHLGVRGDMHTHPMGIYFRRLVKS